MTFMRPALALATVAVLAGCMNVASAGRPSASKTGTSAPHLASINAASVPKPPPAGSRAEAAALATQMLSRLRLPAGARRLPPKSVPRTLTPSLPVGAAASLDVHAVFEVPEPMTTTVAFLSAHVPGGMSLSMTGQGSGPGGASADVAYAARSFPAGINAAELDLTIAPDVSGGSLLRADAQVIWYPPRSAAEYIDPARYRALIVAVTVFNPRLHTITKVVTWPAAIASLADSLDRSEVEPIRVSMCPVIFATYRLGFALTRRSAPVVVVTATMNPCLGAHVTVDGRKQPPLQDDAAVVAIADRLLGFTPRP